MSCHYSGQDRKQVEEDANMRKERDKLQEQLAVTLIAAEVEGNEADKLRKDNGKLRGLLKESVEWLDALDTSINFMTNRPGGDKELTRFTDRIKEALKDD